MTFLSTSPVCDAACTTGEPSLQGEQRDATTCLVGVASRWAGLMQFHPHHPAGFNSIRPFSRLEGAGDVGNLGMPWG